MPWRRPDVVVFYDLDPMPPRILAPVWALGTRFDRTPHSYGVRRWDDVVRILAVLRDEGVCVREIQVWSHGYLSGPVLGPEPAALDRISNDHLRAIGEACPDLERVWWRSCSTGGSYRFPLRVQAAMPGVTTVHHCRTISGSVRVGPLKIPRPNWQPAGVALEPGQKPWWPLSGEGLAGCAATRMRVPERFYERSARSARTS